MADLALDPPSPALTLECFRFPHRLNQANDLGANNQDTGFSGGSDGEESACSAGDLGFISRLGSSPGVGNGIPHCVLPSQMLILFPIISPSILSPEMVSHGVRFKEKLIKRSFSPMTVVELRSCT